MDTSCFRNSTIAEMTANGYMTEEQARKIRAEFDAAWPEVAEASRKAVGVAEAPPDAADIAERLARLNRHQRRAVIARAKKDARTAARKERGSK